MDIKKLDDSRVEFTLTVSWKNWEKFLNQAAEEISKDTKIKGFRPGKAPRDMVEQKVGKDALLDMAAEKAIREDYPKVIAKEKIEAIGAPKVEILKLAEGNDLEYKIQTSVMPEVKLNPWEGDIKKFNKENIAEKVEVTEDEMKRELEKIANSRVKMVTVKREAKTGDNVKIDFDVLRDNVPIENGTSKDHNLILGKDAFVPGFEDNVIGMKEGDEKEFELNFPEKYHEKILAGKPATFKVKMKLVQERTTPEVDDDFAKSLGKFKNLAELKKSIQEGVEKEKANQQKEKRRADMVEELIKKIEVDLPEILIHEELHRMIGEFEGQLQGMGMTLDKYLEQMGAASGGKKTREDLEKEWKPQAEKRIKSSLVLEKVVEQKEIKVPAEKIEEEMNKTLQMYKGVKDMEKNMDMERLYNYTKGMMQNEEVFKMLEKM